MIRPINTPVAVTVDSLLNTARADQQNLSAVERFASLHEADQVVSLDRKYKSLLPANVPGPGQQYAFEVDLDRCTSCKACVTACHNLNNLDDHEAWRSTGLLVGGERAFSYQQTITTACHHCLEPACSDGCPVKAYEKDPVTGIVRHLDDQCIGCKYCTLTCPYDVPKYSVELGIVRKCDMCSQRLTAGEAPACVQACPNQAIRISLVDTEMVEQESLVGENRFLPGTPHPEHTRPTTQYLTRKVFPENLQPADAALAVPEHAHWPLIAMLVLTQLSVGGFLLLALAGGLQAPGPWEKALAVASFVAGQLGVMAALFHLGRPQYAFRALLGLRTSWLSREILAFGLFSGASAGCTGWILFSGESGSWLGRVLAVGAAWLGLVGVFTSVMVYHVTRRPSWHARWSGRKFFLSTAVLGLGLGCCLTAVLRGEVLLPLAILLAGVGAVKLYMEHQLVRRSVRGEEAPVEPLHRSAWLLQHPLRDLQIARVGTGVLGAIIWPMVALMSPAMAPVFGLLSFIFVFLGEGTERWLFFKSMTAARMPGSATP